MSVNCLQLCMVT